jgi:hypothetical protein
MTKHEQLATAVAMAKASGYDDAIYLGEWNCYSVYAPKFNDNEPHFMGVSQYILFNGNNARWTESTDESFDIMDAFYS